MTHSNISTTSNQICPLCGGSIEGTDNNNISFSEKYKDGKFLICEYCGSRININMESK